MATKSTDDNTFESAPDPSGPVDPQPASPAVLQRVEFIGEEGGAFTAYRRETLPAHGAKGDVIAVERSLAGSLVRYYPDRYRLVKASEPATEEG